MCWKHYKQICKFVRFPRNVYGRFCLECFLETGTLMPFMCVPCELVNSASRVGMSWALSQINFDVHGDFTPLKPLNLYFFLLVLYL